jgi:hypothetical protein
MSDTVHDAAQSLLDILHEENDALKRLDFPAAAALVPAKEAALLHLLKQDTGRSPPPLLAELGNKLAELVTENQALLQQSIAVQTRIVQIVARASAPPLALTRYGAHGRNAPLPRAPSLRAVPMALSTRV